MSNPPWIKKADNLFKPTSTTSGNEGDNHHIYTSTRWRTHATKFRRGYKCEQPNCILLADVTDHIIAIRSGGAIWDKRNWRKLCNKHHNKKRGQERHGKQEESIETPHGRIPKSREHLPPDIVGESYLTKSI
jgi:hypothetical protein